MSKSVLISIPPKWCELIASGKKTVEVRKTKPKIDVPFKCYIYCTKDSKLQFWKAKSYSYADERSHNAFDKCANGKVIGEFVCDKIEDFSKFPYELDALYRHIKLNTCITEYSFISQYLNDTKCGYGWHISNLKIYDKPKELSEFFSECNEFDLDKKEVYEAHCTDCGNKNGIPPCEYINQKWYISLKRPPKSWCYVEEL